MDGRAGGVGWVVGFAAPRMHVVYAMQEELEETNK
jgi:hypothetical protein